MSRFPLNRRIARGFVFAGSLALLAAVPAFAAEKLEYAPAESWVTTVEPSAPDEAWAGAPAQILLQNMQVRFQPDGTTTYYSEFAIKIQTAAGLQAAQSWVLWNPATDTATVNKVHILRDGQVIDMLAKGQTFTTMRREQNLDKAMLDGYLTGVMQPEGLQVGDTLVFASSIRRRDPVFGGMGEGFLTGLSSVPAARQVVRATWDRSQPIQWRQSDDLKGKIVKSGTDETYVLERSKITTATVQNDAPARFNAKGYVEFSQFKTWNEISSLLAPLYTKAATLGADSPLRKEAATIRAASNDPKVQAAMALKLVQTQVRYLFLGMNLGGYVPADADVTWQRRFGDCKGKSALLVALLRELGIEAEAAAVHSAGGDGMDQFLPAIELFDHVIVRAEIDGKTYWLDGTRMGDRDLDSLRPPYVRWALPLTTAGTTLEAVPMLPPDKPTEDTFIRLDATSGLDVPAQARVEKVLRGDGAQQFDAAYQAMPVHEREKALKSYWAGVYDWIEPRKVSAAFDTVTGEERLTMEGPARMSWDSSKDKQTWRYMADIMSIGWADGIERDSGPYKSAPVVISFPYYERTRQEIVLPKKGKDFTVEGAAVDKTLGGSEFRRQVALKDGVLSVESSRRSLVPEISYKEAKEAAPALTAMWDKDVYLIAPRSYRKDKPAKGMTATVEAGNNDKSADELVEEAGKQLQQNKPDEALTLLNKALRLEPSNIPALIGRGGVFMVRGNFNAARGDFEMVVKLDPTQWTALNGLASVYANQNRLPEAIDTYTKALDVYPNNVYALQYRARAHIRQKAFDKARLDANAASDLDPDSLQILSLRIDIAQAEHKRDEAKQIILDAIAAKPGDLAVQSMLAEFLGNCTYLDAKACEASKAEAVTEYDKLLAVEPNAYGYVMRALNRPDNQRDKAFEDLDTAAGFDDTAAWPLLAKARLLVEDKAYDKALPLIDKAIGLTPKDIDGRALRADLYLETGRKAEALADLTAVKRENPKSAAAFNASCWGLATHNAELETALADCNTGLAQNPNAMQILDSRGMVKLRLGRFDEAIADYDAALAIAPELPASLYGRGVAKLRKGDKAGGEADLKAARAVWYKIDEEFTRYGVKP